VADQTGPAEAAAVQSRRGQANLFRPTLAAIERVGAGSVDGLELPLRPNRGDQENTAGSPVRRRKGRSGNSPHMQAEPSPSCSRHQRRRVVAGGRSGGGGAMRYRAAIAEFRKPVVPKYRSVLASGRPVMPRRRQPSSTQSKEIGICIRPGSLIHPLRG